MPRYRVTIAGSDYDAMADLVRRHHIHVVRHTIKRHPDGGYSVHAHVDNAQLHRLETAGYRVERHEDVEATGRQRQAEISTGPAALPGGLANVSARTHYLNVAEVEAALAAVAQPPNNAFTQLIALPHTTWEHRTCHAIKLAHGAGVQRTGICLIGGVHAFQRLISVRFQIRHLVFADERAKLWCDAKLDRTMLSQPESRDHTSGSRSY